MKEGRLARLRKVLRVVVLERDEGREEEIYLVNLFALFVLILPSLRRGRSRFPPVCLDLNGSPTLGDAGPEGCEPQASNG